MADARRRARWRAHRAHHGLAEFSLRQERARPISARLLCRFIPAIGTRAACCTAIGSISTSTVRRPPTWLRKEMAWQSVIISNCEDEVLYRFKDWPKLAADAKKYDVTTFEILGWNVGGIDRGYPQYTPDPRLGTREEFRQALAEIRRLGVHPLLFANIQVADTATPLFKEKLHRYAVMGRWAPDYALMGWGEGTISARLGLTRSNMTLVSPSHPEYRKLLVDQCVERVQDGGQVSNLTRPA